MPDQDVPLHRVRGLVSGVNWRVTKFAAPVPPHLTCGLCHVIPRTTFLLPCLHTLCESCSSLSLNDGNIVCPFDEESFAEGDCQKVQLPAATADRLKACCWNEAHGCTFVGPLQAVLTHYEQECTFHAVTCPRCNDHVLQQDLPRHYREGCHGEAIASTAGEPTSRQGVVVSSEDIRSCIDELKELSRDRLPELQSKMNEVLEEARNASTQIAAMSRDSMRSERGITQAIQELQSQQRQLSTQLRAMSEVETSTAGNAGATSANQMPWRLEKRHILRKLELIASDSQAYLELLRTSADRQLQRPAVEYRPLVLGDLGDTKVMPPLMRKPEGDEQRYIISITDIDDVVNSSEFIFLFTQWYSRYKFVQVATYGWRNFSGHRLTVCLKWGTTVEGLSSATPEAHVYVKHPDGPENIRLEMKKYNSRGSRAGIFGFHECFGEAVAELKRPEYVKDGKLTFILSFKV